jgi:hypothetical protein
MGTPLPHPELTTEDRFLLAENLLPLQALSALPLTPARSSVTFFLRDSHLEPSVLGANTRSKPCASTSSRTFRPAC